MTAEPITAFAPLAAWRPFDALPHPALVAAAAAMEPVAFQAGARIMAAGDAPPGLFALRAGEASLRAADGAEVFRLGAGEMFGGRACLNGAARHDSFAATDIEAVLLPRDAFLSLAAAHPEFRAFFEERSALDAAANGPDATLFVSLSAVMIPDPVCVRADATIRAAAESMRVRKVSCLPVLDSNDALAGLITTGDMTRRVLGGGVSPDEVVGAAMTRAPFALSPADTAFDALQAMTERGVSHLPIVENGRLAGIVTSSDLVRRQTISPAFLMRDLRRHDSAAALAQVVAQGPRLLAQMVGAGASPHSIGRVMSGVTDAVTRRLLDLAEAALGPAPIPYLWLACGSQGRQEQTGVSDQDNCLFLDDSYDEAAHGAYFTALAQSVCDGLNACGYVYCPGEMMATTPRWRQPVRVWRSYFEGWIRRPDPTAQMLASVMFDLRPIAGDASLFAGLQAETLRAAQANSIFVAHMVSNALKHTPPLGLLGGIATIRSGDHRGTIDLKHAGVAPINDLGRVYALLGALPAINTRERIEAAQTAKTLSASGGRDLLDAQDFIARIRLEHQARQVRAGVKPDNFVSPSDLSDLEREHLRDAFAVVKTMQSAVGNNRGAL